MLDRSNTLFESDRARAIRGQGQGEAGAGVVGRPGAGIANARRRTQRLPLTGRERRARRDPQGVRQRPRRDAGGLIDVVGESGVGKTRLLEAMRDDAAGFHKLHATCEAYTASTPYAVWRELLRELMSFGRDDPDAVVERAPARRGGRRARPTSRRGCR